MSKEAEKYLTDNYDKPLGDVVQSYADEQVNKALEEVEKSLMSADELKRNFANDYNIIEGAITQRNKTKAVIDKLKEKI